MKDIFSNESIQVEASKSKKRRSEIERFTDFWCVYNRFSIFNAKNEVFGCLIKGRKNARITWNRALKIRYSPPKIGDSSRTTYTLPMRIIPIFGA